MSAPAPAGLRTAPSCRVVVDNDFAGDPDGLVALAHHLLSPTNHVVAVTTSFLDPGLPGPSPSAADAADLVHELLDVVGWPHRPSVHVGSEVPLGNRSASAAADAIVTAARTDSELPLYVVCGGPLTNVAQALAEAPDVAERFVLVWVGGALDADAFEYNRETDPMAAEAVFARRDLALHSFPLETYRQCAYSVAELEFDIGCTGVLGRWLWQRFTSPPDWLHVGGVWPLGDSPPVLVTALGTESSRFQDAPRGARAAAHRTYTQVDFRLLVGDLLAKLRAHELHRAAGGAPRGRP